MHPALKVTRYNKQTLTVIKIVKEVTEESKNELYIYVDNQKVITTPLVSPKVKKD